MKSTFRYLFPTAVSFFCLLSCQEDEINKPPSSFKVLILEVGSNFAVISWEPPSDPDGDALYRTVSLEGVIVAADMTEDKPLKLENLTSSKVYNGTVSITDKKNNPVVVPFQFTTGANQRPSSFNVMVTEIGQNFATLTWDAVTDPENDPLYRTIILEGITVVTDLTDDKPFKLANLEPSKTYSGSVSVTDKKSEPVVVSFTFTTKKYITLFNILISPENNQYLDGISICQTDDSGYVVASNKSSNPRGLLVMKIDSLGNEEWQTPIEGQYYGGTVINGKVIQCLDKGFVIVEPSSIIKLNSSGVLQWQQPTPSWDRTYNSVIETDDGGYLVIGNKGALTKFGLNGNVEWEKFVDIYSCTQIVRASDGNYLIGGARHIGNGAYVLSAAKIDASGNVLWVKAYQHQWQSFYLGINIIASNNGYVLGSTSLEVNSSQHARLTKISEDGTLIWDQTFQWGGYETTCKAISPADGNNLLFVGGYTNYSHYQTAVMVKLNSSGELIWKKDLKPSYIDYVWELRDVKQTKDMGFVFMGVKAWIWSGAGKERGLWLLKTDDEGNFF